MKLIIQIPCLNESSTLEETISSLPKAIPGIASIEVLIIDDGSSDETGIVATELGVNHLLRHTKTRGLAAAFQTGLDACVALGADIVVNTDGDNQYSGADIGRLVAPIVAREADIVVGDRRTSELEHFSSRKKILQSVGSWVVRTWSGVPVADAVSGFRAFSRDAAMRIKVLTTFSYTIETIFQAGEERLKVVSVPIRVNQTHRTSRLFRSIPEFLFRSANTLIQSALTTNPGMIFGAASAILFLTGMAPVLRFLYLFVSGEGDGHIQSVVLGGTLIGLSGLSMILGLLAHLVSLNRRLIRKCLYAIQCQRIVHVPSSDPEVMAPSGKAR